MEIITSTTVLLTISVGFCGFLLFYILKLIKNEQAAMTISSKKGTDKCNEQKKTPNITASIGGGGSGGMSTKSKKKPSDKHSQSTKHSQWLLTTLKGHTGQVLNIDISTNSKYLASCSEDSVDNCDNTTTITTTPETTTVRKEKIIDSKDKKIKIKRRRRRKKRTNKTITTTTIKIDKNNGNKTITMLPLKQYTIFYNYLLKSGYNPDSMLTLFERYLLTQQDQCEMGYPLITADQHVQFYYNYNNNHQQLDVNAKIFTPQMITVVKNNNNDDDSGRSSGNSSDTESSTSSSSSSMSASNNIKNHCVNSLHKCLRCSSIFSIYNNDIYIANNFCYYHHGKLINMLSDNQQQELRYSCCYGYKNTYGCTKEQFHVFNGYNYGWNGPFCDYFQSKTIINNNHSNVYGIDCEMCYTTQGLEVVKLTIVNIDGTIIYDTLIKPCNKILDYNTRYSGITPRMFDNNNQNVVKTLKQVQNDLKILINQNTIIIGHGLENDLRCLKFVHKRCIDTVKLFPHDLGLPLRNSLKNLVTKYLKRTIQNHHHLGHDSYEDACACIELVLWKIRKDLQRERLLP